MQDGFRCSEVPGLFKFSETLHASISVQVVMFVATVIKLVVLYCTLGIKILQSVIYLLIVSLYDDHMVYVKIFK